MTNGRDVVYPNWQDGQLSNPGNAIGLQWASLSATNEPS